MPTKACWRPGCAKLIVKATACRLRQTLYCSKACSAQHRVEQGNHPFHHRTKAQMRANGRAGGRARAEQARRRRMRAIGERVRRHLPTEWRARYDALDLARVIALAVREYREGYKDGYQAGHTAAWRKGKAA